MSVTKNVVWAVLAVSMFVFAPNFSNAQGGGEFDGSTFTCLDYTNGLGEGSSGYLQSLLGQLWIRGFMAGYYKANGDVELSNDPAVAARVFNLMLQECRTFPRNSILAASSKVLTTGPSQVPSLPTMEFTPDGYTCGQHVDARGGSAADANKADLADLWAFAFIQGYKTHGNPDMRIEITNKAALIGALDQNCASNRDFSYMDLAAAVANAVSLE